MTDKDPFKELVDMYKAFAAEEDRKERESNIPSYKTSLSYEKEKQIKDMLRKEREEALLRQAEKLRQLEEELRDDDDDDFELGGAL